MLKLSTVAMTGWLRLSHCRALDLDIAWMGLDGRSAVHRVSGICPKQPWTSVVGMLPPLCHEDFMRHIYDNVDAFLQASCGNWYAIARTKSKHLKVFFSSCFFRPLFLALKSNFFPASLKYFHLWIFGTEKKTATVALVAHFLQLCNDPLKNNEKIEVAMLAIYERFDALEALKSGSSGMTLDGIFEVLDFLLRIQKGILAMDLDTSIDSWCFAVLNGVFWETQF